MAEPNGALDNLLTLDETNDEEKDNNLFKYGVYQIASQKPDENLNIQKIYGTSAMPIFEWVKTIQTGERTYNPNNPSDVSLLNQYNDLTKNRGVPEGYLTPEQIEAELIKDATRTLGSTVGTNVGMALGDPMLEAAGFGFGQKVSEGLKSSIGFGLPDTSVSSLTNDQIKILKANPDAIYDPKIATKETADLFKLGDVYDQGKKIDLGGGKSAFQMGTGDVTFDTVEGKFVGGQTSSDRTIEGLKPETQKLYEQKANFGAGSVGSKDVAERSITERIGDRFADSRYQTAGYVSAGIDFGVRLVQGEDPMDAAKSAADTGLGTYIGGPLGGPVGAVIGATVVPKVFGRIICNELRRQNLMKPSDVTADLDFTVKYLTPRHIKGYQFWAVWVVLKLREGKMVKFWHHIAQHRCNEIKYILGKSDKPDYLGKLYRHIFEPICYVIGIFAKKRDISFLWKKGEKHGT